MKNIYCVIFVLTIIVSIGCKEDQPSEPPESKEPIVEIITPGNNSSVYGNTYIEVEVTHDKNIAIVEVYIDGISDPGKTFEFNPGMYRYVWSIPQSANGRTYNIYATAEDEDGSTGRSETIEVVVYRFPAPTELNITHISQNEVELHWIDNTEHEDGYIIERKTGIDYSEIGRVDADVITYNDNSLSEKGKYYYRVKAYTGTYNTDYSNEIRIHYVQILEMANILEGHSGTVAACDFNPVQDILATGSADYSINLWNFTDGSLQNTLIGHESYVNSVVFTPNGEYLASGSSDRTIKIWNVLDGELVKHISKDQHTSDITAIDINPDGEKIVSVSSDRLIKMWDIQNRDIDYTIDFFDDPNVAEWPIVAVEFSPDGGNIAFGQEDRMYIIRPSSQLNVMWPPINMQYPSSGVILCIDYSFDGKNILGGYSNGRVYMWEVQKTRLHDDSFTTENGNKVFSVSFSPDGEWILCGGSNGLLYSVKASSREKIEVIDADNGVIYSIDYSPDGSQAASCHQNGNVILWDVSMRWTIIN